MRYPKENCIGIKEYWGENLHPPGFENKKKGLKNDRKLNFENCHIFLGMEMLAGKCKVIHIFLIFFFIL